VSRTIDGEADPRSIVGFSPDFRAVNFDSVGQRATVALRKGGKIHPWMVALLISRELAREAGWAGESHVIVGVSSNPTIKRIEIRCAPSTAHSARRISEGRAYCKISLPYVKDLQLVIPEIRSACEARVFEVNKERIVLDFSAIRATGMPVKKP
jgi:hypothetical protein